MPKATEQKTVYTDETRPKHLDDFKGTPSEVRQKKADFITQFGYGAYEELVRNSSIHVKR